MEGPDIEICQIYSYTIEIITNDIFTIKYIQCMTNIVYERSCHLIMCWTFQLLSAYKLNNDCYPSVRGICAHHFRYHRIIITPPIDFAITIIIIVDLYLSITSIYATSMILKWYTVMLFGTYVVHSDNGLYSRSHICHTWSLLGRHLEF